jgi:hypothetical protein
MASYGGGSYGGSGAGGDAYYDGASQDYDGAGGGYDGGVDADGADYADALNTSGASQAGGAAGGHRKAFGEMKIWVGTWNVGAADPFIDLDLNNEAHFAEVRVVPGRRCHGGAPERGAATSSGRFPLCRGGSRRAGPHSHARRPPIPPTSPHRAGGAAADAVCAARVRPVRAGRAGGRVGPHV